jgi:hypothetical protein
MSLNEPGEQTTNKASHQKGGGGWWHLLGLAGLRLGSLRFAQIPNIHVSCRNAILAILATFVKKSFGDEVPAGD